MKLKPQRRERYLRDPLPIRLGGIAANLARVVSFAENPISHPAVTDLLYESKFFIEWAGPTAPLEVAAVLVELQIALAIWQNRWVKGYSDPTLRNALIEFAREWSNKLLEMSGLLETKASA
jgi:hypothetical protein